MSISRKRGDPRDLASISHNRSSDTGDLKGWDKTGPLVAARSAAQEKEYHPRNWAKTKPAKATANNAVHFYNFAFLFSLAVKKRLIAQDWRSRIALLLVLMM